MSFQEMYTQMRIQSLEYMMQQICAHLDSTCIVSQSSFGAHTFPMNLSIPESVPIIEPSFDPLGHIWTCILLIIKIGIFIIIGIMCIVDYFRSKCTVDSIKIEAIELVDVQDVPDIISDIQEEKVCEHIEESNNVLEKQEPHVNDTVK